MNAVVRQALALGIGVTVGLIAYLVLLASPVAHEVPILFYRGTLLAVVAALVGGVAGIVIGRRCGVPLLALPTALTTFSLSLCFLVVFPVTIDRSISVYLLATIDVRQDRGIDARGLEASFVDGYVRNMHAIDRRIAEQVQSGNLKVAPDGRLHLTPQGIRFVAFSRRAAMLFGTDPRFVEGRR